MMNRWMYERREERMGRTGAVIPKYRPPVADGVQARKSDEILYVIGWMKMCVLTYTTS